MLKIKKEGEATWDLIALGEVMLRFDPGDDRIQTARSFRVWEGGGEYNVARTLSHCFRARTSVVTALADNHVGRLVEDLIRQGGVDTSNIIWREVDGISGNVRNGLNFVERGFGLRPPAGCSDRANTAISKLTPDDLVQSTFFEKNDTRWFHTGGIFAALSDSSREVALAAMRAAKASGAVVSYDLNYRESLWSGRGGRAAADEANRRLLAEADVVFGVEGFDPTLDGFSIEKFDAAVRAMLERHSNLKVVATSLRDVASASEHSIGGAVYIDGTAYIGRPFKNVRVLDRVGSGDAFAGGVIYGMLNELPTQRYIDLASANAAYAMTCPGDTSTATLADLVRMLDSGTSEIKR
ncbi:MAG: sugar kinase [Acidobacteria bacterium ACB1]|nr:2-dehydro-3-deoxygluconokinase [Pyrinomonadaceae bacterium]MCE7961842.1 sugar kinase [Acidobacteria bacterium ACB1]RIJ94755.1 MAG: sugar kinase [Acidobacteriota bacterium]